MMIPSVAKLEVLLAELASVTTKNAVWTLHASVVDAVVLVLLLQTFDNRVDHDEVLDLWSC